MFVCMRGTETLQRGYSKLRQKLYCYDKDAAFVFLLNLKINTIFRHRVLYLRNFPLRFWKKNLSFNSFNIAQDSKSIY